MDRQNDRMIIPQLTMPSIMFPFVDVLQAGPLLSSYNYTVDAKWMKVDIIIPLCFTLFEIATAVATTSRKKG